MRYVKIENGHAVNAIELDNPARFPEWVLVQSDDAGIGDTWDGSAFTKYVPTAEEKAAAAKLAKDAADAASAKVDAKLIAIATMTPAQIRAWVAANVTNLADAKDVLATLAVAVSILARKPFDI